MRYAQINQGKVFNVVVGIDLPLPFVPCGELVQIGWDYNGTTFTPPVESRRWTAYEFLNRFTPAERAAIRSGSQSDSMLADFLMMSQAAQEIVSDDPVTVAAMGYLVSLGILSPARRAEILS
jgi:hypothetical protein